MWISKTVFDLFHVAKDEVTGLREEMAAVRAERDLLKTQLTGANANFNWLRLRVNALEVERAALVQRAYGIALPVPEVVTAQSTPLPDVNHLLGLSQSLFEDMGDPIAKEFGHVV